MFTYLSYAQYKFLHKTGNSLQIFKEKLSIDKVTDLRHPGSERQSWKAAWQVPDTYLSCCRETLWSETVDEPRREERRDNTHTPYQHQGHYSEFYTAASVNIQCRKEHFGGNEDSFFRE